jgi:hypothetical protein
MPTLKRALALLASLVLVAPATTAFRHRAYSAANTGVIGSK